MAVVGARHLIAAMVLCFSLGPVSSSRAAQVLPVEAQGKLLSALKPTGPGDEISGGWSLGDVKLTRDRVMIHLRSSGQKSTLLLLPLGTDEAQGTPLGETASFRALLQESTPIPHGLRDAAQTLLDRISASDEGYYKTIAEETTSSTDGPVPIPAPAIPVSWSLALGCLLLLLSGRWGLRGTVIERRDIVTALALLAVALVLRWWLGPHTFLHENSRGPRELEALLGLVPIVRPMGGQLALQSWFTPLFGASVQTVTMVTTVGSALAVPLVYALSRVLGTGRAPSAVAGLLLATLPVAVRVGTSADAFPMATTLLVAACLGVAAAARVPGGAWLVFAGTAAGLAGVFRPTLYAIVPFLAAGLILLRAPGERLGWLKQPISYGALGAWFVLALPDVLPSLQTLGQGSALTMGWWSRNGLHGWPMMDPAVTPVWLFPLAGGMGILAGVRRADLRPAVAWLLLLAGGLTFLYSSDNGWPASLRYAVAYGWILPVFVAMGLDALPTERVWAKPGAMGLVGLLALSIPVTHGAWIGHKAAQQEEVDFQQEVVLPALLSGPVGTVITPWPTLDHMSGTLLTTPLLQAGWTVVGHAGADEALGDREAKGPLYWYRGLACWARPVRGAKAPAGLHPTCEALERAAPWRPAHMRDLAAQSDADWILLGDGSPTVEVGLLRGPR